MLKPLHDERFTELHRHYKHLCGEKQGDAVKSAKQKFLQLFQVCRDAYPETILSAAKLKQNLDHIESFNLLVYLVIFSTTKKKQTRKRRG